MSNLKDVPDSQSLKRGSTPGFGKLLGQHCFEEPKDQEIETEIEFLPSLIYLCNLHRYHSIFAESMQSEFSLTAVHILGFFPLKAPTDHK